MDTERSFSTDNLALAVALKLNGIYPVSITQRQDGRAFFRFDRTPEVTAVAMAYFGDELQVCARSFATEFAATKRQLVTGVR